MSPAAGAVAMGTGAVATAMSLDGRPAIAHVLVAVAAAAWVAILCVVLSRVVADDRAAVRAPAVLTVPAATAVLGSALAELHWTAPSLTLLVLAAVLWAPLAASVLAAWEVPTTGVSLLVTVSTEALAVLGATVGIAERVAWLAWAAAAFAGLGLVAYVWTMASFELRELVDGPGDHWIAGGAVAISTLATAEVARSGASAGWAPGVVDGFDDASLALWCVTIAWLVPLLACEALRPRPGYRIERWSTVFPVGMYAICSFAVGSGSHVAAITAFARAWTWVALAVWLAVFWAMLWRGLRGLGAPAVRRRSARPGARAPRSDRRGRPARQPTRR